MRDTFAEADEAAGFLLSKLIFEGPEEELKLTENTQPAILTVSVATLRVLALHGIEPALATCSAAEPLSPCAQMLPRPSMLAAASAR